MYVCFYGKGREERGGTALLEVSDHLRFSDPLQTSSQLQWSRLHICSWFLFFLLSDFCGVTFVP